MSKKLIAGAGVVAGLAVALAPVATFATTPSAGNQYVSQLDQLSVTVEPYCSFGYAFNDGTTTVAHGEHTNGTGNSTNATTIQDTTTYGDGSGQYGQGHGNWHDGTNATLELSPVVSASAPDIAPETAYGVMENGTYQQNFAKTKLTVICNNRNGYTITAKSTNLTSENSSAVIAQTSATPSGSASTWSFQFQNATGFALNGRTETGSAASAAAWLDATANAGLLVASIAPTAQTQPSAATTATGDSYEATYGVGVGTDLPADTYTGTILYTLAQL